MPIQKNPESAAVTPEIPQPIADIQATSPQVSIARLVEQYYTPTVIQRPDAHIPKPPTDVK